MGVHLFILLKDQPLPLCVDCGQRQWKIGLAHLVVPLEQTEMFTHKTCVRVWGFIKGVSRRRTVQPPSPSVPLGPPTCVSSPARPSASSCGCTRPCSSRSASPASPPSGPACASSPACPSAAGSRSAPGPPLRKGNNENDGDVQSHDTKIKDSELIGGLWGQIRPKLFMTRRSGDGLWRS